MKTLGLDLGTNSIGWALVESHGSQWRLAAKGVNVFPKGVKDEKNIESSRATERTEYRAARRLKQRRRWRKQATLEALVKHQLCPGLSRDDIDEWRNSQKYPMSPVFHAWLQVRETTAKGKPAGPYFCRWQAATQKLDLENAEDRHRLGRAFYHMAQRRGYRSNRLSDNPEKEGVVKKNIDALSDAKGSKTL